MAMESSPAGLDMNATEARPDDVAERDDGFYAQTRQGAGLYAEVGPPREARALPVECDQD